MAINKTKVCWNKDVAGGTGSRGNKRDNREKKRGKREKRGIQQNKEVVVNRIRFCRMKRLGRQQRYHNAKARIEVITEMFRKKIERQVVEERMESYKRRHRDILSVRTKGVNKNALDKCVRLSLDAEIGKQSRRGDNKLMNLQSSRIPRGFSSNWRPKREQSRLVSDYREEDLKEMERKLRKKMRGWLYAPPVPPRGGRRKDKDPISGRGQEEKGRSQLQRNSAITGARREKEEEMGDLPISSSQRTRRQP